MKRLAPAMIVIVACTSTSVDTTMTTADPPVSTTVFAAYEVIQPGDGLDAPTPPPAVPGGDVSSDTQAALEDVLTGLMTGSLERESVDQVVAHGDPRVAWLIADLLRFYQTGQDGLALATAFTRLTGAPIDNDGHPYFVPAFDNLFAWDLPAWDGYELLKRRLYTAWEPAWDVFFEENVSLDWRYITWGGVLIDARPFPASEPCPRGCIPSLDNPPTTDAAGGDWYPDDAIVFGVTVGAESIALPKNQMEVHEMVNLTLGGRRVGIPYCTLCGSAQAYLTDSVPDQFDSAVLRTSGLLSRSNKVMYDLTSGSVFDTFTGEAKTGALAEAGVVLDQVTVVASRWGDWKAAHPDTQIIARDGGVGRLYDPDPLGGRDDDGPIFPVGPVDSRLGVQDKVLGVVHEDVAYAFPVADLTTTLKSARLVLEGFEVVSDGTGFRAVGPEGDIPSHEAFWFAWSQFHPDTVVIRSGMS